MTNYKIIMDSQGGRCKVCGNVIVGQPIFAYRAGLPTYAICTICWLDSQKEEMEKYEEEERQKTRLRRASEREDWLNPEHKDHETRLNCHIGGHKVVHGGHGYIGGGCWCGYYSPEERPLLYQDYGDELDVE